MHRNAHPLGFKPVRARWTLAIRHQTDGKVTTPVSMQKNVAEIARPDQRHGLRIKVDMKRIALTEIEFLNRPAETATASGHAPAPKAAESTALVSLGEINAALRFTVSPALIAQLGFSYRPNDKNIGKFYREADLPLIYEAIARHVLALAARQLKAAA
jgi:hypothetical protein